MKMYLFCLVILLYTELSIPESNPPESKKQIGTSDTVHKFIDFFISFSVNLTASFRLLK